MPDSISLGVLDVHAAQTYAAVTFGLVRLPRRHAAGTPRMGGAQTFPSPSCELRLLEERDLAVDVHRGDWGSERIRRTSKRGIDLVLDHCHGRTRCPRQTTFPGRVVGQRKVFDDVEAARFDRVPQEDHARDDVPTNVTSIIDHHIKGR